MTAAAPGMAGARFFHVPVGLENAHACVRTVENDVKSFRPAPSCGKVVWWSCSGTNDDGEQSYYRVTLSLFDLRQQVRSGIGVVKED